MSSNLAERIANDLMAANMLCGPATVVGVGHLIEKLLAAHEAQQMKDEYKAIQTAIDIMLKGNPGAAQNAVREDYPELARIVDKWKAQQAERHSKDLGELETIISDLRSELNAVHAARLQPAETAREIARRSLGADAFIAQIDSLACEIEAYKGKAQQAERIAELEKALRACQLQMLQSNNNSEYAQQANEMARAALRLAPDQKGDAT